MSSLKQSCPGSREIKSPYPEEITCVFCGSTVEIWTDEVETTCPSCNRTVNREMKPSCIEWCPAAKECVGSKKYEEIMQHLKKQQNSSNK